MNIKQLKELTKDLPDEMEVQTDNYELIGGGQYEWKGWTQAKLYNEGGVLRITE